MSNLSPPIPIERVERMILLIRGQKVILDRDLAFLYGIPTFRLNEQVRRNRERFPPDFMFQFTKSELKNLTSQFAMSSWGGRRTLPYAFTEHGALMAATVLRSDIAIRTSILIVRTFVRLRKILLAHEKLARKLDELEKKYDAQFCVVFDAIRQLMTPPEPKKKQKIGFKLPVKKK